jgi:hypothetical protein
MPDPVRMMVRRGPGYPIGITQTRRMGTPSRCGSGARDMGHFSSGRRHGLRVPAAQRHRKLHVVVGLVA